jgi:hypothetical protein
MTEVLSLPGNWTILIGRDIFSFTGNILPFGSN